MYKFTLDNLQVVKLGGDVNTRLDRPVVNLLLSANGLMTPDSEAPFGHFQVSKLICFRLRLTVTIFCQVVRIDVVGLTIIYKVI